MAISDKTRKFLWAKSGNRCAMCKTELISNTVTDEEFNIGEECHIISPKSSGPRHYPNHPGYDNYENLILLCKNHHKEIDTLTETFTEEILRYIKTNHENWVKKTINDAIDSGEKDIPRFLAQITSGKELLNIIHNAHAFKKDYDDALTENEVEIIAVALQNIVDYGDISGMVEEYDRIKIGYELQQIINELDKNGYLIFGERSLEVMFSDEPKSEKWNVATIVIKKKENPDIIKVNLNDIKEP